uniref:Carboxylesterase type B domain-containing protein n=1 Tax=Romanomermis culicivorax TaxID=13658 RepID=A0A915K4A9_ROMCU
MLLHQTIPLIPISPSHEVVAMPLSSVLVFYSIVEISVAQPQRILPFVASDNIPEITHRPISFDIYDPFRSTTRQSDKILDDEVVVRLSVGQLIGKNFIIDNLAWAPDSDEREFDSEERIGGNINYKPKRVSTSIFTFLGVPYAQKPVGRLRFQLPQKLPRLPGDIYFADKFSAACAQDVESRPNLRFDMPYEHHVDEDCLYLNVFTPQASLVAAKNYPVIVFFHGGNFQTGASNDWPAYVLSTKGLVVVTANYRLGAFGFLSLGGRQANFGLWDQKLVLEWIQEHIYAFGGDKSRVTVVGHDAGAVSAGLHMLSPFSAGLITSVAALSGAEVAYHQVITHPMLAYNNTLKLGRMVGCFSLKSGDILECLKTRSTRDIVAGTRDMLVEFNRYSFLPTIDKNFLSDLPQTLLNRKEVVSPLPYLTGINLHDGAEVL